MFVFKIYWKILEVFHNNKDQPMTAMDVVKKVYTVGSDLFSGVCICNLINFYTKKYENTETGALQIIYIVNHTSCYLLQIQ